MKAIRPGQRWIPIDKRLPEVNCDGYGDCILLSFSNYPIPTIGRYDVDEMGNGAFYDRDDDKSLSSHGLFVNAWMPLPKCYKEDE